MFFRVFVVGPCFALMAAGLVGCNGNELYGACFSTVDHRGASEPDRDGRTNDLVHGSSHGDRAAELPVAEERREHRGRDFGKQHDPSDGKNEQHPEDLKGGNQL